MIFSSQLPLNCLIDLCRTLRHLLGAGLTLRQVFKKQAASGPRDARPVAQRIFQDLEEGESLELALEKEKAHFPPLFLALAKLGEQTGTLPEMFGELEKYYQRQQSLWRQFLSHITMPLLQFFGAIGVIALMLFVLGILGSGMDPIGFGTGAAGAMKFLFSVFLTLGILAGIYVLATRTLKQKAVVDELLLNLPSIGPCLRAFAMMRFCTALRLTLETALPIVEALTLSLKATGNAAFSSKSTRLEVTVRSGADLTAALTKMNIFSEDFLGIVAVAEEGGRVPEVMRQQAEYYEEEATRKMAILTKMASFGVWAAVAIFIIIMIFRIYGSYLSQLQGLGL